MGVEEVFEFVDRHLTEFFVGRDDAVRLIVFSIHGIWSGVIEVQARCLPYTGGIGEILHTLVTCMEGEEWRDYQ